MRDRELLQWTWPKVCLRKHHTDAQARRGRKNPSYVIAWEAPKVILRNKVLEIRNVDGVLHIARRRVMSSLMTDVRCAATHQ
jgi:hypothetical protein